MRVVGCFIKSGAEFLLLYRSPESRDGMTWSLPSGAVDNGETDQIAIIREIKEETDYDIPLASLKLLGEYAFNTSIGEPSVFIAFEANVAKKPVILLNPIEHTEHTWVTIDEAVKMDNLIHGQRELFRLVGYI